MSKISPKLIDVEGNRIGTEGGKMYIVLDKKLSNEGIYGGGKGLNEYNNKMKDVGGRFPTQLFTNKKEEQYKYVKNIT